MAVLRSAVICLISVYLLIIRQVLAQDRIIFQGTLTLQIQGGQAGSTCNTAVQAFQQPAVFQVSGPVGQETNRFDMVLQTTGPGSSNGGFAMFTATVVPPATLQFWQIQSSSDGYTGTGTLTETHVAEAYALNTFVTNDPIIPYQCTGPSIPNLQAVAVGATLSYTIAPNLSAGQITVKGINTGQNYQFQANFQGSRTS